MVRECRLRPNVDARGTYKLIGNAKGGAELPSQSSCCTELNVRCPPKSRRLPEETANLGSIWVRSLDLDNLRRGSNSIVGPDSITLVAS